MNDPLDVIGDLADALTTIEHAVETLTEIAQAQGNTKIETLLTTGWQTFLTAWDAYTLQVIAPTIRILTEETNAEHRSRYGSIANIAGRIGKEATKQPPNTDQICHDANEIRWHAVKGASQC